MSRDRSNDDCPQFYRPQGCPFGGDCSWRHSEAARGCYEVCPRWLEGACQDWVACHLRHMSWERIEAEMRTPRVYYPQEGGQGEPNGGAIGVNDTQRGTKRAADAEGDHEEEGPERNQPNQLDLKCPVCLDDFLEIKNKGLRWKTLNCGHLVCSACAATLWGGRRRRRPVTSKKCPVCQKEFRMTPIRIYL